MKIGIITIQDSKNYGACLQAYALQNFLSKQEVSVELIDLRRLEHNDFKKSKKFKIIQFSEKLYKKAQINWLDKTYVLLRKTAKKILLFIPILKRRIVFYLKYKMDIKNRDFKFYQFFRKVDCSDRFFSIDDLYSNPPDYDIFLVGSDQVWNPYNNYNVMPYFLTFTENKNKYTYASSIGTSKISQFLLDDYAKYLKNFKCVSVREKEAFDVLEKRGVNNIRIDLDPTFLLSKDDWSDLASAKLIGEDYIFLFALTFSEDIFAIAKNISEEMNLPIVCIAKDENDFNFIKKKNVQLLVNVGIEDWLSLIKYSSLVVTDSFHGTVFSMFLAQKYFTYIAPLNTKGERIYNLLKMFNQNEHLIDDSFLEKLGDKIQLNNNLNLENKENQYLINNSKVYLQEIINECRTD